MTVKSELVDFMNENDNEKEINEIIDIEYGGKVTPRELMKIAIRVKEAKRVAKAETPGIKFDNISSINDWSNEELKNAIAYYQKELLKPHDDVEHNWFLRSIGKCKTLLDERTGNKSEWESLFK